MGRRIVTASNDRTARTWDATTGKQIAILAMTSRSVRWRVSPDGRRIVTACAIHRAHLGCEHGKSLTVLSGDADLVWAAAVLADGRRIVTHLDQTARVWDEDTAKLSRPLRT